jgi:hypothetical protein
VTATSQVSPPRDLTDAGLAALPSHLTTLTLAGTSDLPARAGDAAACWWADAATGLRRARRRERRSPVRHIRQDRSDAPSGRAIGRTTTELDRSSCQVPAADLSIPRVSWQRETTTDA